MATKYIDQLTEDAPIPSQLWCCISFISPETLKNCNLRAVKVRGVYNNQDEAIKRAEYLQKIDPDFNIFVGEVGKWLGWDPDPNTAEDQVYREKKLQEIMSNYKKNREKAKVMEEERKREMLEESVRNEAAKNLNKVDKKRDKMRRKLEQKRLDSQVTKLEESRFKSGELPPDNEDKKPEQAPPTENSEQKSYMDKYSESDIKAKEKLISAEKERLSNNENIINKSNHDIGNIDNKLNKLQSYYRELIEKKKKQTKSN